MLLDKYLSAAQRVDPVKYIGRVKRVQGILVESEGPRAAVGELCRIIPGSGEPLAAEVVAVRGQTVQLMSFDAPRGLEIGDEVAASGSPLDLPVGPAMLGRVFDALGRPMDGRGPIPVEARYPMYASPPPPMERRPIHRRIDTGIRAIDAVTPLGRGQRLGIFAGSGVGKSTLLGMAARGTSADVNVIALIGERGREVREFIEDDLGPEGLGYPRPCPCARRLRRHRGGGVLPGSGKRCAAALRFGYPLRHEPEGDRPGRGRAAHHPQLYPLGVLNPAPAARTPRSILTGNHHRPLHRTG